MVKAIGLPAVTTIQPSGTRWRPNTLNCRICSIDGANKQPHKAEKLNSFDNIYANFKDGSGMQLVSIYDKRFCGFYLAHFTQADTILLELGKGSGFDRYA